MTENLTAAQLNALHAAQPAEHVRYPGEHGPATDVTGDLRIPSWRASIHRALRAAALIDAHGILTGAGLARLGDEHHPGN